MCNDKCKRCVHHMYTFYTNEEVCEFNKTYDEKCFETKLQKYVKESLTKDVNEKATVFIDEKKKTALVKAVYYKKSKYNNESNYNHDVKFDIEIDGESLLYTLAHGINGIILMGYKNNDIFEDKKIIEIENNVPLKSILWKASGYSNDLKYCK